MLTKEEVVGAYRLILEREPENQFVVDTWVSRAQNLPELMEHFINSAEFKQKAIERAAVDARKRMTDAISRRERPGVYSQRSGALMTRDPKRNGPKSGAN